MRRTHVLVALSLTLFTSVGNTQGKAEFPIMKGPYMGQTPPGNVAEPFAPGVISKAGWQLEGVFSPGLNEFYFTTDRGDPPNSTITVIGFRQKNNVWKKYIEFPRRGEITFSPDGNRMHMAGGYKDRVGTGWSERKSLGPLFDNDELGIMRLTASEKGTYVFDDYKSKVGIRISEVRNGKRQPPEAMSSLINTGEFTAHPFISPDDSYLIWDSKRDEGYGASDLYISFRQTDGSWGPAINMGDTINSEVGETYATVTSDGKYLLFNRRVDHDKDDTDIYWVDAQLIEDLRSKHASTRPQ